MTTSRRVRIPGPPAPKAARCRKCGIAAVPGAARAPDFKKTRRVMGIDSVKQLPTEFLWGHLRQVDASAGNFMLKGGSKVIYVSGGEVASDAFLQEYRTIAAHSVAAQLDKKSMDRIRVEFLWCQTHNLAQRLTH